MPRRRFQPGISNHPKPRGRPTQFPRFIQESRFLSNLPIAVPGGLPIFLLTSKEGIDEHKIYKLATNSNSLKLISTQSFGVVGDSFGFNPTAKRLGNSHYILINDTLWRSRDQCVTFEPTLTYNNNEAAAFGMDAGGRIWLFAEPAEGGTGGLQTIRYSDDDGDSWINLGTTPTDNMDVFEVFPHPTESGTLFCIGAEFSLGWSLLYTTDRFTTWQIITISPNSSPEFSGFEIKGGLLTATGRFITILADVNQSPTELSIFYSDDPISGNFTEFVLKSSATGGTDYFGPVIALSADKSKVLAFASESPTSGNEANRAHIFQSEDDGSSWEEIELWPVQLSYDAINSGFYDGNMDRLVLISAGATIPDGDGEIWVSRPPGSNWQEITPEEGLGNSAFMVIWR